MRNKILIGQGSGQLDLSLHNFEWEIGPRISRSLFQPKLLSDSDRFHLFSEFMVHSVFLLFILHTAYPVVYLLMFTVTGFLSLRSCHRQSQLRLSFSCKCCSFTNHKAVCTTQVKPKKGTVVQDP